MREDLLREAELETQEIRRRNEETEQRRRAEIVSRFPEIRALTDRREELIHGTIRSILNREASPEDLPERMEKVSAEIRALLKKKGYPEDYLAPVYTCPLCRDTGFVGETVRERCSCVMKRYQAALRRTVGLAENGAETFETYDERLFSDEMLPDGSMTERQGMAMIRNGCEKWADNFPRQYPRDLVLSGKSGVGKTFLLHAIAQRLIQRGHNVLLLSAYSFLETARRSYFGDDGGLEDLIEAEALMLDDLGSEPLMQNVTIEQLFNLINERQRRNRATAISTNLTKEELKNRYTERIASRLTDTRSCLFLPLRGKDLRNGRK